MDQKTVINIAKKFKFHLEASGVIIDRLILFGSYAVGTQTNDSDIDLVVISKSFSDKDYWNRINILTNAIYSVKAPIVAIAYTPEEWNSGEFLVSDFAKNGVVIN